MSTRDEARSLHNQIHEVTTAAHMMWVRLGEQGVSCLTEERRFYDTLSRDLGELADKVYDRYNLGGVNPPEYDPPETWQESDNPAYEEPDYAEIEESYGYQDYEEPDYAEIEESYGYQDYDYDAELFAESARDYMEHDMIAGDSDLIGER